MVVLEIMNTKKGKMFEMVIVSIAQILGFVSQDLNLISKTQRLRKKTIRITIDIFVYSSLMLRSFVSTFCLVNNYLDGSAFYETLLPTTNFVEDICLLVTFAILQKQRARMTLLTQQLDQLRSTS